MKSTFKIIKLAERFEQKLVKIADEVDSTIVTLSVRPIVNPIINGAKKALDDKVMQIAKSGKIESGDIKIGEHFYTTAKLVGGAHGKWVVDPSNTKVAAVGSLASEPAIIALLKGINAACIPLIQNSLNRQNATIQGDGNVLYDMITNHDSSCTFIESGFTLQ